MKAKPWPILILAFLHFMAPIGNIFISALIQKMSIQEYLSIFFETQGYFELFMLFCALPIAGYSIYKVKGWSFFIFLFIAALELYSNIDNWLAYPDNFSFPMLILAYLVNIGVVSFVLLPKQRAPYFNHRLRWWEQKPRFNVNIRTFIYILKSSNYNDAEKIHPFQGKIVDISEGGLLIKTAAQLKLEDEIKIHFNYFGITSSLPGKIVHYKRQEGWLYGVQFLNPNENRKSLNEIKKLTQALRLLGIKPVREQESRWQSFKEWWYGLFFKTKPKQNLTGGYRDNIFALPLKNFKKPGKKVS